MLLGLWLPAPWNDRPAAVDVIVHRDAGPPATRSYSRRAEVRARRQMLLPDEIVSVHGLPVTSPARTWLDLAAALRGGDLLALGDSVLRSGTSADEVGLLVERARHRPGVVRARQVLPLLNGRARSRPESHLRWIIVAAGLPVPRVNEAIHDAGGGWMFEPDLSYDDVHLALEYNGTFHREDERMQRDITRTLDVEDRGGWRVVTFGKVQVFRRPDVVARRVRDLRVECALLHSMSGPKLL